MLYVTQPYVRLEHGIPNQFLFETYISQSISLSQPISVEYELPNQSLFKTYISQPISLSQPINFPTNASTVPTRNINNEQFHILKLDGF